MHFHLILNALDLAKDFDRILSLYHMKWSPTVFPVVQSAADPIPIISEFNFNF